MKPMKELRTQGGAYPRREVNLIVIHCSATRRDVPFTPAMLERAHRARGFRCTGYHFYITRDGAVHHSRPLHEVGAHARGFNLHSIGVCYEGGLDEQGRPADTRTTFQRMALIDVLTILKRLYPHAVIKGHCQLGADIAKACPCFDAEREYALLKV